MCNDAPLPDEAHHQQASLWPTTVALGRIPGRTPPLRTTSRHPAHRNQAPPHPHCTAHSGTFCTEGNRLRTKRPRFVTFCTKRYPTHKTLPCAQNVPAHRPCPRGQETRSCGRPDGTGRAGSATCTRTRSDRPPPYCSVPPHSTAVKPCLVGAGVRTCSGTSSWGTAPMTT